MIQVEKRDGMIVEFDIKKISAAIQKAFRSTHTDTDSEILDLLALRVSADIQSKIQEGLISVEQIQDSVEKVLSFSGYTEASKAYILYRKQRENVRRIKDTAIDYSNLVDSYLNETTVHDQETSLETFSLGGLILSNSGAITSNYWLHTVYDEEIANLHRQGWIHIHDLNMLTGDSAGWSLRSLIEKGLCQIGNKITSRPPKHLSTVCSQLVNFLGILQNEWAGAQSISSVDTYLAPFVKKDQLSYEEIHDCMETFVYGVNIPSRWGTQAPFSSISLDWDVPSDLLFEHPIIAGASLEFTYGDCQREMELIQEALLDVLLEGDASGRGFQFPILTVYIDSNFSWEPSKRLITLFKLTNKYGTPYFANGISALIRSSDVRQVRSYELGQAYYQKAAGYFSYGENTGSIGTVTINLPRIAYVSKDEDDFMKRLENIMDIVARSLYVKRQVLTKFLQAGLYPYTSQIINDLNLHVSSIGLIGFHEACLNADWLHCSLMANDGQQWTSKVLSFAQEKIKEYTKQYQTYYCLEATPAEGVSYRFARLDKDWNPNMPSTNKQYYTCASDLHASSSDDVLECLHIQEKFQKYYNGSHCFQVYMKKGFQTWKDCANFVKKVCTNYQIDNFAISLQYSICPHHGYFPGKQEHCPICQSSMEITSRVAGYYQPITQWNPGKKEEFLDRKEFVLQ